jgi:hypothetical protein
MPGTPSTGAPTNTFAIAAPTGNINTSDYVFDVTSNGSAPPTIMVGNGQARAQ